MVPLAPSIGGHLDPQGNPFGCQQRPLGVHLPGAGPPIRTLDQTNETTNPDIEIQGP
jgi:hypothetical protein